MWEWLEKLTGISKLKTDIERLNCKLDQHRTFVKLSMEELKKNTRLDADIGMRSNCSIILTGVYRKRGYVKFYDIDNSEFQKIVEHFNDMKKTSLVRNVDVCPSFRGAFEL